MKVREQIARNLLDKQKVGTIATATRQGKPEAATLNFVPVSKNGYALYFTTFDFHRNYTNLKETPRAAFVITDRQPARWNTYSLQLDGRVRELKGKEFEKAKRACIKRFRPDPFYEQPETCMFLFTPTWARVLDYEGEEPRWRELDL